MRKIFFGLLSGLILDYSILSAESSLNLENELKNASAGLVSSRFRLGYFLGGGYQGTMGSEKNTEIQGILVEGGVYTLFNPIRNFFDIEVGLSGKYNFGSSNSDNNKYYAGLKQITLYGGTVFRFGETKKAVAVGVSKALYIDEVQTDDLKKAGIKKHDLKNGIGTYIEYQSGDKKIFFVRAELERIDVVYPDGTDEDTIGSILIGMKF